jgi:hypothetical protein
VTVAELLNSAPLNISFGRALSHDKWIERIHLGPLMEVDLSDESDKFTCHLTASGGFYVKSFCLYRMSDYI